MTKNQLLSVLEKLTSIAQVKGIKIVLMGGIATSLYSPPRATFDIDGMTDIPEGGIDGFLQALKAGGFDFDEQDPVKIISGLPFVTLYCPRAKVYVDLFLARSDFQKQLMTRSRIVSIDKIRLEIVSPEDLILVKLLSGHPRDVEDVRQILAENAESLDFPYLLGWSQKLGVKTFLEDEMRGLRIKTPPGPA